MSKTDITSLGDRTRNYTTEAVEERTLDVAAKNAKIEVNNLEVCGGGPVLLDGVKVKRITGIKLEWSVDDPVWRAEIKVLLLPGDGTIGCFAKVNKA